MSCLRIWKWFESNCLFKFANIPHSSFRRFKGAAKKLFWELILNRGGGGSRIPNFFVKFWWPSFVLKHQEILWNMYWINDLSWCYDSKKMAGLGLKTPLTPALLCSALHNVHFGYYDGPVVKSWNPKIHFLMGKKCFWGYFSYVVLGRKL